MFLRDTLEILGSDHPTQPTPIEASLMKSRQKEEEPKTMTMTMKMFYLTIIYKFI